LFGFKRRNAIARTYIKRAGHGDRAFRVSFRDTGEGGWRGHSWKSARL
jgi:hypothetical protein